jgi:hypothetical protein
MMTIVHYYIMKILRNLFINYEIKKLISSNRHPSPMTIEYIKRTYDLIKTQPPLSGYALNDDMLESRSNIIIAMEKLHPEEEK